MAWSAGTLEAVVAQVAVPAVSGSEPQPATSWPSSMNVTLPPIGFGPTVAVYTTGAPVLTEAGDAVTVVKVGRSTVARAAGVPNTARASPAAAVARATCSRVRRFTASPQAKRAATCRPVIP